jgi:hypothetical protein
MVDGDSEGADAALYAADRAQKCGSSEDAVLDALEAAEEAFNANHQPGDSHEYYLTATFRTKTYSKLKK